MASVNITDKGARRADEIIGATMRVLARDGFSGTSMQRIADEAGTSKRMLHYYFETREGLLDAVAEHVSERILGQIEEAIAGLERPDQVAAAGFDRFWTAITADPHLHVVYFGMVAESTANPAFRNAVARINARYRELIARVLGDLRRRGNEPVIDEQALVTLIVAGVHGLTLAFIDRGAVPEVQRAITEFRGFLAGAMRPVEG